MKHIALLALVLVALALSGSAIGGTSIAPHTETEQSAYLTDSVAAHIYRDMAGTPLLATIRWRRESRRWRSRSAS